MFVGQSRCLRDLLHDIIWYNLD